MEFALVIAVISFFCVRSSDATKGALYREHEKKI